ncbi:MAG: response regulator [Gracilimonas sp.]|nr:response regulator [Gracilimonas sp.]
MSTKKDLHQFKLSEIVDRLSHELRTPLGAILGYSELLEKSSNLDDQEKAHLKKISASGGQLLNVINDIIEISNIESGQVNIENNVVNLEDLVRELKDKFKVQLRYKNIDFNVTKSRSLPKKIMVDENKLHSILFSLITNAIKFSEGKSINIHLNINRSPSKSILTIIITDAGVGIKEEDVPNIFDPFWQGDMELRSGTGLGLTTCKKLVEILNGHINVSSELGKGTEVEIQIPVKEVHTGTVQKSKNSQYSQTKYNRKASTLTALIVDDLQVNRTLARIMLEMKNFKTIEAENGEAALKHYNASKPDVVLMDISMPVMNGIEAMQQIRLLNESEQEIPIIAITAGGHGGNRSELLEKGFSEYIQKPFKEKELFEKISQFLPAYSWEYRTPKSNLNSNPV